MFAGPAPDAVPDGAVVVARDAVGSGHAWQAVASLIDIVNQLFGALLLPEEVGDATLVHYYVDFYVAQVDTGGHSQFFATSLGSDGARIMRLVSEGISHLGLPEAAAIWAEFVRRATALTPEELDSVAQGCLEDDGFHPLAALDELDDAFLGPVSDALAQANAQWLRSRPELVVLDDEDIPTYVAARAARLPDLAARIARARDSEPSFVQAVRAYCEQHGLSFEQVTTGVPATLEGHSVIEWGFVADGRLFTLVELPDGSARVTDAGTTGTGAPSSPVLR